VARDRRLPADPGLNKGSRWVKRSNLGRTTDDIVAAVKDASLVIDWFGGWPDFHDAEVVSLAFDRGNLKEIFETGEWSKAVKPNLSAVFLVRGLFGGDYSAERRATLVTLKFVGFERFSLDRLNHQNPIIGVEIIWEYSKNLQKNLFAVDWGGTLLRHEVSFACEEIEVESVKGGIARRPTSSK
jgi:hypothetical protein